MSQHRVSIEVSHMDLMSVSTPEIQKHIQRKLCAEYLSTIEQKMTITSVTNPHKDSIMYTGDVVILSLDEYNKLRYNSVSREDKFKPFEPKQEFDAVNYLKNLMKKSR
jgi:hypothetical protein